MSANSKGTSTPVKKKTSGFSRGDIIKCTHAVTNFFTVGKTYDVGYDVYHGHFIYGDDGLIDSLVMLSSKFEKVDKHASGDERDGRTGLQVVAN